MANVDTLAIAGPVQSKITLIVTVGMMLVIGVALAFEHVGGYAPAPYAWNKERPIIGAFRSCLVVAYRL